MTNHDDIDEPCALAYEDAPGYFHPRPKPPAGMTWWKGWWPSYGINSLDDLKLWVESRLEEMISLQGDETLADIGLLLGVQALKNADRYLGLFGKGDHPPRPADDQLERVEDVEDALESVVRYLRQQLQPAGAPASPQAPAAGPGSPPLRGWVQTELDAAIHKYIADRAASYNSLRKAVEENRKGAVEKAREMFGRNVVAAALGVKAKAMVSKSPGWQEVAKTLRLGRDGLRRLDKSKKIGLEIAEEKKVESQEDPVVEEAARREAAALIRSKLKGKDAELLLDQLELGNVSTEQAMEYAQVMLDHRDDTRTQRPRKSH